jgi:hypothetical protein
MLRHRLSSCFHRRLRTFPSVRGRSKRRELSAKPGESPGWLLQVACASSTGATTRFRPWGRLGGSERHRHGDPEWFQVRLRGLECRAEPAAPKSPEMPVIVPIFRLYGVAGGWPAALKAGPNFIPCANNLPRRATAGPRPRQAREASARRYELCLTVRGAKATSARLSGLVHSCSPKVAWAIRLEAACGSGLQVLGRREPRAGRLLDVRVFYRLGVRKRTIERSNQERSTIKRRTCDRP